MASTDTALPEVARVFHFEYWLRYYFIEDRDNELFIVLSEEQRAQMQKTYPQFWELVERIQDLPLSPELSQQAVVEFLQLHLEGKKFPANMVVKVLDSKAFSIEMYLFDTWASFHEDQLAQKIYGFDYWMHAFSEWKNSEKGTQLAQSLRLQMQEESGTMN